MPNWKEIIAARTGMKTPSELASQARIAEVKLRAMGHSSTHSNVGQDQSERNRAYSGDRPDDAALDRKRGADTWAMRYDIPIEGAAIRGAGPESIEAAQQALGEKLGYEPDLRALSREIPGSAEWVAKHCPPPEPFIDRWIDTPGEGMRTIRCDIDGNPLEGVEPQILELPGPGPIQGTPEYAPFDHSPKVPEA